MREPSQIEEAKPQSQDWFEIVTLKLSDQQPIRYDFGDNILVHLLESLKIILSLDFEAELLKVVGGQVDF